MDIKNSPERYAETVGIPGFDLSGVRESVDFLLSGAVDYEFRTTVCAQLHSEADFHSIGRWLQGAKQYAIQNFRDSGDVLTSGLSPCTPEQLARFVEIVKPFTSLVLTRGDVEN